MVITRLYGGLGNQMFQYAAGIALAARLRTRLVADTTWFDPSRHPAGPSRTYELDAFGVRDGMALGDRLALRLRPPTVFAESGFAAFRPAFESTTIVKGQLGDAAAAIGAALMSDEAML